MQEILYAVATASFEAARRLDIPDQGERSRGLHGHSFLVRARATVSPAEPGQGAAGAGLLAEALQRCLAPLDYSYLNDRLGRSSDGDLVRWVKAHLPVAGVATLGIRSAPDTGADLDPQDHLHLWQRFRFEAAHYLPKVPPWHKCSRMHGHGFEVILHADQALDPRLSLDLLQACWKPLQEKLHYACLNDLPGLENPTSERLAAWIWQCLKPSLPSLSWVTVRETASAGCLYDGNRYRIWKELRFESALRQGQALAGDPRHRLHGHSYRLCLHLGAPLDESAGWIVDFGEIQERFCSLYQRLDHHRLDNLPGLQDPRPEILVRWMHQQTGAALPFLERIDLFETPRCGVILSWGEGGAALPL